MSEPPCPSALSTAEMAPPEPLGAVKDAASVTLNLLPSASCTVKMGFTPFSAASDTLPCTLTAPANDWVTGLDELPVCTKALGARPPSVAAFTPARPAPLPLKLMALTLPPNTALPANVFSAAPVDT